MKFSDRRWYALLIGLTLALCTFALSAWILSLLISFVIGAAFGFLKAAAFIVVIVIIGGLLRKGGE